MKKSMINKPVLFIQQPELPFQIKPAQNEYRFKIYRSPKDGTSQSILKKESKHEVSKKNKKQESSDQMVDYFLDKMTKPEQNEILGMDQLDEKFVEQYGGKNLVNEEEDLNDADLELHETIRRLALYPPVLQKPWCQAKIDGEKVIFQVLSKRGDHVRIRLRRAKTIKTIDIQEIKEFKIL